MSATSTRFHEIYAQSVAEQEKAAGQAPALEVMDRRGFLALCGAALAAAAGLALAPRAALAADATSGTIKATTDYVKVKVGEQAQLNKCVSYSVSPYNGDCHLDYAVTSGTAYGMVNKHSGVFTGSAVGTCVVTVYLIAGLNPGGTGSGSGGGTSAAPDGTVLAQCTITVDVAAAAAYGYQGGTNAIMMTSPAVVSFTQDGSTYKNDLGELSSSDGYYYFTILTSAGFRNYNTPALFADVNAGNVVLLSGDSGTSQIAALQKDNTGNLTIYSVDHDTRTVVVRVAQAAIGSGDARLTFLPGFRGNNASSILDATVYFLFDAE
jgi:hypothetical protein